MSRRRSAVRPPPRFYQGRRRAAVKRAPHDNVRAAAGWVLERTLASRAPVDSHLASAVARCDERDHALLFELVRGTLRWLRRIDYVLATAANRRFDTIEGPLRAPLRIAAYQLLFLSRLPSHAIVHEAVDQAHHLTHRGGASFVNAVLRRLARSRDLEAWPVKEADPAVRLAIEWSHPDFLVQRWLDLWGESVTRRLLAANNSPKSSHLLAFKDRGGRELLAEALIDEGLEIEPSDVAPLGLKVTSGSPLGTEAFRRGDFYIQDEASQLAALIPPPRPNEEILDVAAAPGGKTFAILSSEPDAQCWASDVSLARLQLVRENLKRLQREVPLTVADAVRPPFSRSFDRVVIDLPCSGTGTLRKNPELKWRVSMDEIGRLSRQGLEMLDSVAPLVRLDGLLVAITCSLEPEENEQVVERFLERWPGFLRLPLEEIGERSSPECLLAEGLWRLLTARDHDGFTVSALRCHRRR